MDTEASDTEDSPQEEATPGKTGRPPPIVITATVNLLQLQKLIKSPVKETFEFRKTRNGTRVILTTLGDFAAVKSYLETHNLHYFTFYPKSLKPIKAIVRHLHLNTPEQEISDGLEDLGFDIISVKQMSNTRRSTSEGTLSKNLPLFLISLPRTAKSQKIFRLTDLCHIAIRVETYRAQNGLTQCHNCQQFGHVWANCKQPPRCLWCGGGHLHKECPEIENATSTPACCNCRLAEGGNPIPPILGLQTREGGAAEEEIAGNTQNYNGEGVLLQPYYVRCLLRGGAPRQYSATKTTADAPSSCGRSTYRRKIEYAVFWTTTHRRSVSSGSNCKQPTS
jgi:hypothetical protein